MKPEFTKDEIIEAEERILLEFAQAVTEGDLPILGIEYRKKNMKVFASVMGKLVAENKVSFIKVHENKWKFYRLISQEDKTA